MPDAIGARRTFPPAAAAGLEPSAAASAAAAVGSAPILRSESVCSRAAIVRVAAAEAAGDCEAATADGGAAASGPISPLFSFSVPPPPPLPAETMEATPSWPLPPARRFVSLKLVAPAPPGRENALPLPPTHLTAVVAGERTAVGLPVGEATLGPPKGMTGVGEAPPWAVETGATAAAAAGGGEAIIGGLLGGEGGPKASREAGLPAVAAAAGGGSGPDTASSGSRVVPIKPEVRRLEGTLLGDTLPLRLGAEDREPGEPPPLPLGERGSCLPPLERAEGVPLSPSPVSGSPCGNGAQSSTGAVKGMARELAEGPTLRAEDEPPPLSRLFSGPRPPRRRRPRKTKTYMAAATAAMAAAPRPTPRPMASAELELAEEGEGEEGEDEPGGTEAGADTSVVPLYTGPVLVPPLKAGLTAIEVARAWMGM